MQRPPQPDPLFHVVLVEPEIPNNTGNAGRTCAATGCALHLVHPLGFETDEKAVRRAGMDYWLSLDVREHAGADAYRAHHAGARRWLLSAKAERSVFDADLRSGDHLVFGRESSGLSDDWLDAEPDRCLSIPILPGIRGLNLATSVATVVYLGLDRLRARGEVGVDAAGRLERTQNTG
ncbi:MAG: tRNA (cytidine(34)-2'-O)-methyltransferase [Planctomycetota bacterium]